MDPAEQSGVAPEWPKVGATPLQEARLEAEHQHTWPDQDDRLTMDLEPYPDSQVY